MNKSCKFSLILACILVMTGCGTKLALDSENFTVTPQVLEAIGGKVDVSVDGVIPAKALAAKEIVTITPVLKYEGGEVESTPITLQGEKVVGNNKVISKKEGGSYNLKASFDYKPEMSRSELFARITVSKGDKTQTLPDVKIADGVICTEALANAATAAPAASKDKFQRVIQEVTEANIMFLIQQSNIRSSEMKSEEVKTLAAAIASAAQTENKEIAGIKVSSYASPDGAVDLNEKLAGQREKNTVSYLNKTLKKAKAEGAIDAEFTAEDWAGFQALLNASNVQDKALILRVLSMYSDPEQREQEIKKLASAYKVLANDILPQLRRSKMALTVDVIGKSDEEIKDLLAKNPAALSVEEMLYAASLYSTAAEKESAYQKTARTYPKDYRAYNNIGLLNYAKNDLKAAKTWFEKAYTIEQAKEVCLNLALCAIAEDADNASIEAYLNKAAGAENYGEAVGLLYIKKGQYNEAVKAFGNVKSNNAALAQLLAKDYSKAKATLNAVENADAETAYLQAVVGARTNNKADVVNGLKKAIAQDASLAKKAAKDLEFAKYATDAEVSALLK